MFELLLLLLVIRGDGDPTICGDDDPIIAAPQAGG
jgi:hypothetical protein